ncbi:UDP-4-amino-4,6-dideoxy-N-acetyl-beta-L-altrosamine N-acetyltransferase [Ancylobacter vacuolatus]|uniref:UDP-4-amino-4, 6-dideoxy-N-acetyl-beta-L-altrosamine N-acetyltransferase n=1 Tax=Ancylobacter vacuolatus TaxID=223389 RepID=A0ABU0DL09_9HYPH|nr:UDP-4-amino-4,6-dideoxy-N-acetyl-beta-L-altrosamine N-acetyltransferase [Ancylobacter vacuolatus]MDQ0349003.1 UDP-4-amino-4,6-dideoxy-N-acetyl-beta-L-altrosamine N-acetyltransferase [Ancylobacter vacuolatus]
MAETCTVRPLTADDLPTLLAWRNHPDVRRAMFTQHEISPSEHEAWFAHAPSYCARLIVEEGPTTIGFAQFNNVAPDGVSDWGFYARPGRPKGTGTKLGQAALGHAFDTLKLHKVYAQVMTGNLASLALHRRLGFIEEGLLRDQKLIHGAHHSLVHFGLLQHEWRAGGTVRSTI